jgi:hypothetical protein
MFIANNIENIDLNNIFQSEKIKNTIIENSEFIKIFYSDINSIQKGLTIICPFKLENNNINKNKYFINTQSNRNIVEQIIFLEKEILEKFNFLGKPKFQIEEQITNNNIILYSLNRNKKNATYILKISGLWIDKNNYGLTFKFLQGNSI